MRRQILHALLKNVIVTTSLMESDRPESSPLRSSNRKGLRTPLDSKAIPILPFQSTSIRSRSGKHTHARIHVDGRTRTRVPQAHKRWSELRPTADCRTCEFTYVRHACTGWARHTNRIGRANNVRCKKPGEHFALFDVIRAGGIDIVLSSDVFETINKFFDSWNSNSPLGSCYAEPRNSAALNFAIWIRYNEQKRINAEDYKVHFWILIFET